MFRLFNVCLNRVQYQKTLSQFVSNMTESVELSICFPTKTFSFSRVSECEIKSKAKDEAAGDDSSARNRISNETNLAGSSLCLDSSFVNNDSELFIVQLENEADCVTEVESYVNSCLDLHPLYRSSKNNPTFCFGYSTARLGQTKPLAGGHLKRLLCCAFDKHSTDISALTQYLQKTKSANIYQLGATATRNYFQLTLKHGKTENDDLNTTWKLQHDPQISTVDYKNSTTGLSPIFNKRSLCPVFHEIDRALRVLEMCKHMHEVKELLQIYKTECQRETTVSSTELKFPFVVIEGLDATGKTTLTETLRTKLGAVLYCTPPPLIQHLRKHFVCLPEIVARAYYEIGNHIVSRQILLECQTQPVILDRYWHSTAAYGIAMETSISDMPHVGDTIYNWPSTLLQPNIVLFLSVTEETRKSRMSGRQTKMSFEEQALDSDFCFRERLYTAYKRFVDPPCVEIDANGSIKSVEETATIALRENGINFD